MKTFSPKTVFAIESQVVQAGIVTSESLMKRAGYCIFLEIQKFIMKQHPDFCKKLVFLVGKGKNGGDALYAAQYACQNLNISIIIALMVPFEEMKDIPNSCFDSFNEQVTFYPLGEELPKELLEQGTIIIDGLFGIGFHDQLPARCANWIEQITQKKLPVIAIDIPSGLNGETGEPQNSAFTAYLTICLGVWKSGVFSEKGRPYCGHLVLADLGYDLDWFKDIEGMSTVFDIEDARRLITSRQNCGNKFTFGSVVVIGGSTAYPGAPVLSAESVLRCGSGRVSLVVPYGVRCVLPPRSASIIVREVSGEFGYFNKQSSFDIESSLQQAQSVVFGPGVGRKSQTTEALANIFATCNSAVIDADGLWHMMVSKQYCGGEFVITPHAGEVEMLLAGAGLDQVLESSREEQAKALAKYYGCVVVYKGLGTLVVDEERVIKIASGNNGLATAGSGDVLSGMIAGFLSQGMKAFDAAALGCWIHGRISEIYPYGCRTLIADELPRYIGEVFKELTPYY